MAETNPLFTGFAFIVLRVRDIDETIRFYTENLGFYLLRKYIMEPGGPPCAYLGLNDVLLECITQTGDSPIPRVSFGLAVTDLDAAMHHVRSRGIQIVLEQFTPRTFWGRQAGILDPNGHGISMREWRAPDNPRFLDWQPAFEGTTRLA